MERIKIYFEYQCCPIWVYDEDGMLLYNGLPQYLQRNEEIDKLCRYLQDQFDSQYIDDGKVFEYIGFRTVDQRNKFIERVKALYDMIVGDGGNVVDIDTQ